MSAGRRLVSTAIATARSVGRSRFVGPMAKYEGSEPSRRRRRYHHSARAAVLLGHSSRRHSGCSRIRMGQKPRHAVVVPAVFLAGSQVLPQSGPASGEGVANSSCTAAGGQMSVRRPCPRRSAARLIFEAASDRCRHRRRCREACGERWSRNVRGKLHLVIEGSFQEAETANDAEGGTNPQGPFREVISALIVCCGGYPWRHRCLA